MRNLSIGIFYSGSGSTLRAVQDSLNNGVLNLDIKFVVSNRTSETVTNNNYDLLHIPFNFETGNREEYQRNLLNRLSSYECDFYLLLGWNMILNSNFIDNSPTIYNLHPALPGTFIGNNAVEQALQSFQRGETTHTGSMLHQVTSVLDKGPVMDTIKVNIENGDTLETLTTRVKSFERGMVISFLQNMIGKT